MNAGLVCVPSRYRSPKVYLQLLHGCLDVACLWELERHYRNRPFAEQQCKRSAGQATTVLPYPAVFDCYSAFVITICHGLGMTCPFNIGC